MNTLKNYSKKGIIIYTIITCFILILLILSLCFYFHQKKAHSDMKRHVSEQKLKSYATKHQAKTIGNEDAKVKIYVFEDLQCSDCKSLHKHLNEDLNNDINNGKVNITFLHHLVINDASTKMAHMEDVIKELNSTEDFETFQKEAYNNQQTKDPKTIVRHIDQISNKNEIFKAYDKIKNQKINNDGKKTFDIESTPTVFVNGDEIKNYNYIKKAVQKREH